MHDQDILIEQSPFSSNTLIEESVQAIIKLFYSIQSKVTQYTVQQELSHPVYSSARAKSPSTPSIQFSKSQVTQYIDQLEPSNPLYTSATAKPPSIQFRSHPVYSSAGAKSPSTQFSQSQVTQYIVQLEPNHPLYTSAAAKSPSIRFS